MTSNPDRIEKIRMLDTLQSQLTHSKLPALNPFIFRAGSFASLVYSSKFFGPDTEKKHSSRYIMYLELNTIVRVMNTLETGMRRGAAAQEPLNKQ